MNYFPKAIEIVTDETLDHQGILTEIAKSKPAAVVKAFDSMNHSTVKRANQVYETLEFRSRDAGQEDAA